MSKWKSIKRVRKWVFLALCLSVPMVSAVGAAADEGQVDKTLSPYFLVLSEEDGVERLPLEATSVVVDIAGVIADVRVTQVYKNEGTSPIEAIYVFPASTRASVYGMKMTIGERVRMAKIEERKAAKKIYDRAKQEGKSASLLEQQRPNVFQMSVANIMPGDEIKVELSYTEDLVPTDGTYEFVYPTVVGPRYSNQPADTAPPDEHWIANPYLMEGEPSPYEFDITVNLSTGIPVKEVYSPSHVVNVAYSDESLACILLDHRERRGGNRDFILRYRMQGGSIKSGLLLYEGKKENFFMLAMEPPKRVTVDQIPPREFIYVVDVSGSMNGFPLDTSKKLLRDLLTGMRPVDTFNVLLFAGGSRTLSDRSLPATEENIRRAMDLIDTQRGGGGTEILPALERALKLPRDENVSRTIVIATDGYVAVEAEAFDLIRENLNNANVFAFGIGSSVNRHLIEGLAHVGFGEPFVVTRPAEAHAVAARFREYIESPVLTNIAVEFEGFEAYDVEPPSIPDLFADRPLTIFGKWKGKPAGKVLVRGRKGEGPYVNSISVEDVAPSPANSALRYLWARHRIKTLGDYERLDHGDERKQEITRLGLTYNLLTAYTSFVAVDDVVRNATGKVTKIKQPLPLPQGVSNNAVGGDVSTVPEPETYLLISIIGVMFLYMGWKHFRKMAPERWR
jgi:Ca-activated chloride channel family protein